MTTPSKYDSDNYLPHIQLDQLCSLAALTETTSYRSAANITKYKFGAVRNHVMSLEEITKHKLLNDSTRKNDVSPFTEEGQKFSDIAVDYLESLQSLNKEFSKKWDRQIESLNKEGLVTVFWPETLDEMLGPRLKIKMEKHINAKINFVSSPTHKTIEHLESSEFGIGVVSKELIPEGVDMDRYEMRKLFTDEYKLVVQAGTKYQSILRKNTFSWSDLNKAHAVYLESAGINSILDEKMEKSGAELEKRHYANGISQILGTVSSNDVLGFVSALAGHLALGLGLKLRTCEKDPIKRTFYLIKVGKANEKERLCFNYLKEQRNPHNLNTVS